MDLRERLIAPEPVERLRHGDGIDRLRDERHPLGRAVERLHVRERLAECRPHLGDRLDGDHLGPGPDEERRQLPRPRGQVEDDPARPEAQLPREERDRLGRIGRPSADVRVRHAREAAGRLVDVGAHPRRD